MAGPCKGRNIFHHAEIPDEDWIKKMNTQWLGMVGYFLSLCSFGLGFYLWRKINMYIVIIGDLRGKAEASTREIESLNAALSSEKEVVSVKEQKIIELEAKYKADLLKNAEDYKFLKKAEQSLVDKLITLEKDFEDSKQKMESTWNAKSEEWNKTFSEKKQELLDANSDLKKQVKAKEDLVAKLAQENATFEKRFQEINLEDYQKCIRKLQQTRHLYQIMKGQKELAEERNENWEIALKHLGEWIYSEVAPDQTPPANLGTLVSGALQLTKNGELFSTKYEDEALLT